MYHKSMIHKLVAAIFCQLHYSVADGDGGGAGGQQAAPVPTSVAAAVAAAPIGTMYVNLPTKFHFKKDELGNKRPTVEIPIPVPTAEAILHALTDEKQRNYILELVGEAIYGAAREQVGDDTKPVNKAEEMDYSKLSIEALANLPKAERRGGGISKEVWELFGKDYASVMPALTGFSADQVGNAVKLFLNKFQLVKTNKKVIGFLKTQLALWFTNTTNQEEFQECYDFLDQKADALLKADEASLLANLGG